MIKKIDINAVRSDLLQYEKEMIKENKTGYLLGFIYDGCSAEELEELYKLGCRMNVCDENGKTPLMYAVGNDEQLEKIIELKGRVNAKNNDGETALMIAVQQQDIESVYILLNAGAKINIKNEDNETALSIAKDCDFEEIIELLKKNGATENKLNKGVEFENDCIEILKCYGWDAKRTKRSGDRGAYIIAYKNNKKAIFQCKNLSKTRRNIGVQAIYLAIKVYSADVGAVIINDEIEYTKQAKEDAKIANIKLLQYKDLPNFNI